MVGGVYQIRSGAVFCEKIYPCHIAASVPLHVKQGPVTCLSLLKKNLHAIALSFLTSTFFLVFW